MSRPAQLAYGRAPARTRRWLLIWLGVIVLALVPAKILWQIALAPRWTAFQLRRQIEADIKRGLEFQQQCLAHTDPSDQIVFTTVESEASQLYGNDRWPMNDGNLAFGAAGAPNQFASMVMAWDQELTFQVHESPHGMGVAFLHERQAVGGVSRLVSVDVRFGGDEAIFCCSVIVPGRVTFLHPAHLQVPLLRKFMPQDRGESFRAFAGQIDPNNPAAFTIRCVYTTSESGKTETLDDSLDGKLNPDDTVSLIPRRHYMPESDWELLRPDGTPLTPWNSPQRAIYGGGPTKPGDE